MAELEPFKIAVERRVLADLRARLRKTRMAEDFANGDWTYGTNADELQALLDYWIGGFDWRAQQREINRFKHYRAVIDGVPIHFIRQPGKGPRPIPLILTHGWPWTFWDFQKVIRPLADPASFGGDPADAFDVVVPSLPGFGFSSPLRTPGVGASRTADLWARLMGDVLGYGKFAAHGGDWGAIITAQLGHKYADRLIGIHICAAPDLSLKLKPKDPADYAPEEAGWRERTAAFIAGESGYAAIQTTKPQTLAYGINDSPAGLCAWITEKRRTWSDCGGRVETRFSKDDLLTTMTIYWATATFGTSARFYYESVHGDRWRPSHDRKPVVEAPTAVAVFPKEVMLAPRAWTERYYNLKRWTRFPSGGHFAPMEEPQRLVEDIRAFFATLR